MRSVFTHRVLAMTVIVVCIAGCSGSHPAASASHTAQPARDAPADAAPGRATTMADAAHCPATIGHALTTPWREEKSGPDKRRREEVEL